MILAVFFVVVVAVLSASLLPWKAQERLGLWLVLLAPVLVICSWAFIYLSPHIDPVMGGVISLIAMSLGMVILAAGIVIRLRGRRKGRFVPPAMDG